MMGYFYHNVLTDYVEINFSIMKVTLHFTNSNNRFKIFNIVF